MTARAILDDLHGRGLRIEVHGERLRLGPKSAITDRIRALVRANKPDLLAALQSQQAERLDADAREHFDERAAIAEYHGGLLRRDAEQQAASRIFEYQLAERPGSWLAMVAAPGDGVADAERCLLSKFGAANVLEVRPYAPGKARP